MDLDFLILFTQLITGSGYRKYRRFRTPHLDMFPFFPIISAVSTTMERMEKVSADNLAPWLNGVVPRSVSSVVPIHWRSLEGLGWVRMT